MVVIAKHRRAYPAAGAAVGVATKKCCEIRCEIRGEDSSEDGEDYRKRIASMVPVATSKLRMSSASNSDRSSLMVQA
jgi:hypothetical protein